MPYQCGAQQAMVMPCALLSCLTCQWTPFFDRRLLAHKSITTNSQQLPGTALNHETGPIVVPVLQIQAPHVDEPQAEAGGDAGEGLQCGLGCTGGVKGVQAPG